MTELGERPHEVGRFIFGQNLIGLHNRADLFKSIWRRMTGLRPLGPDDRILEIGSGTGWFQIMCGLMGVPGRGLEISPDLVEHSRQMGRALGLELDVDTGNIEESDLGVEEYDAVVAISVFEHVQLWRQGFIKIYRALKPGGIFYMTSPNKFCPINGEYYFPFYGALPDRARWGLRRVSQGKDIMNWGIDFNQFTPHRLRAFFKWQGYCRVLDLVDVVDPESMNRPNPLKMAGMKLFKSIPPLKHLYLFFGPTHTFVCQK